MHAIVKAVLPTRGLIHAKTVMGLFENINRENIIIVNSLPMPDCFNVGISTALDQGATHIWMVEEDNELPRGTLEALLALDTDIATMDYNVASKKSHIYRKDGEILWCGVGCTLIKRQVFERVKTPWFECNKHLNFKDDGFEVVTVPKKNVDKSWGGHDSYFFYKKCRPKGFEIKALEGWKGEHYRVKEIPKIETNSGTFTIYSL